VAPVSDDHVVVDPEAEQSAALDELPREVDVFLGWRRISGRVVVDQDEMSGRLEDRLAKDLPGVDDRGRQAPLGDEHVAEQPVLAVEQRDAEDLLLR
jgi:hypothetical protein